MAKTKNKDEEVFDQGAQDEAAKADQSSTQPSDESQETDEQARTHKGTSEAVPGRV